MNDSPLIALFSPPGRPARSSTASAAVSLVVHVLLGIWIVFGLRRLPQISDRSSLRHYTVRELEVPPIAQQQPAAPRSSGSRGSAAASVSASSLPSPESGGSEQSMPRLAPEIEKLQPRRAILIQPEAPPEVVLKDDAAVPPMLQWTAPQVQVRRIEPMPMQPSLASKLMPRPDAPNHEPRPADLRMASSKFSSALTAMAPGTTTPVVLKAPLPVEQIAQTATKTAKPPSPTPIVSLSNLRMREGPVTVPLANAPGRPVVRAETPGLAVNISPAGHGNPASTQPGTGAGTNAGSSSGKTPAGGILLAQNGNGAGKAPAATPGAGTSAGTGTGKAPAPGAGAGKSPAPGAGAGSTTGSAPGSGAAGAGPAVAGSGPAAAGVADQPAEANVTRIHLNKEGQFGFVVVGSSIADQYPETVGIWGGRLVYTVYLHLGPGKAWILQYSLPADSAAQVAGGAKPEAPWPYDIVQPHLDSSAATTDALMVHGFVNPAGRFEHLAVVFPTEFAQARFLTSVLQQWQFRPGRQNGQLATLEVLLIIPEEND